MSLGVYLIDNCDIMWRAAAGSIYTPSDAAEMCVTAANQSPAFP